MYGFGELGGTAWGGVLADLVRVPFADAMLVKALREAYGIGLTFVTGRVCARAELPAVLALIESGQLQPEQVTSHTASWDDAPTAFLHPGPRVVVTRSPTMTPG